VADVDELWYKLRNEAAVIFLDFVSWSIFVLCFWNKRQDAFFSVLFLLFLE